MAKKIRVLIADDITATRDNIYKLMEFQPAMVAAGQAATAEEAITLAQQIEPDVILMDVNMPGMDGITAAGLIKQKLPAVGIVLMSVQGEDEYINKALLAGAAGYLTKPFTSDELLAAVESVCFNKSSEAQLGRVITVFSSKGGMGKTMLATNLAVALARTTGQKVAIVDGNLQFGDVALFLDLLPRKTIADLVLKIADPGLIRLDEYLCECDHSVAVLPAPFRFEQAELITGDHFSAILQLMRQQFTYVIVDTASALNNITRAALKDAEQLLIVSSMDLPAIKNLKLCLEILDNFHYPHDKIKLILNRANSEGGMVPGEVEESLQCAFTAMLPSEGRTVVSSVNKGIPFVISNPETPIAQGIFKLAAHIVNDTGKLFL
ncbi:response regulator|uniref:Pilus assembly protein CpaE n=1 Tax=Dendrosporobacter quercicolus TaxID=146817 RepID=A0A1G9QL59_9FIRM|nr:response regulator [Dendrosporobacter quercicolus]NSL48280.1 response regulator [Dendrosporobacter quercicolus DSM 1736]SDM11640.1 pilus assembly protein CpaE [Dendrosporobacter quercicolus]